FDIHGGGMDLLFPHHESEIAQSTICNHQAPVRYWMHNNMITINGRKMGKSYNNVIRLTELFSGTHPLLEKPYHPMTVRFFILQTHYSSTLDFSNEALQAAEKGLKRLWEAYQKLQKIDVAQKGASKGSGSTDGNGTDEVLSQTVNRLLGEMPSFMNDDFSTAKVLANFFELVPIINAIYDGHTPPGALGASTLQHMQQEMTHWLETVLGLRGMEEGGHNKLEEVMRLLIDIRKEARGRKDFVTSDKIRDRLASVGIQLKDLELSPLNETLKALESSKDRSWTNIARDITEAEKNGLMRKRMNTTIIRSTTSNKNELITHDFPLKGGRPCSIQRSSAGLTKDLIGQFIQGMKAQLVIYEGTGEFKTSITH
ncbi:MAG: hypothetical protein EB101_12760, partial [Chitinophagia bacterium]|nr:hypothetical protein [Chitinophagia bacterium]